MGSTVGRHSCIAAAEAWIGQATTIIFSTGEAVHTTAIRDKNRAHRPVHYPELVSSIEAKTGTSVSARTVRRYGKQELGVKQKRTVKRTAAERKHTHHTHALQPSLVRVL